MAHYYTRRRIDGEWGEINGPFDSHGEAMGDHTNVLMRTCNQPMNMQTLIDIATVAGDEQAMIRLLNDDPALRAVFELGRRLGRQEMT